MSLSISSLSSQSLIYQLLREQPPLQDAGSHQANSWSRSRGELRIERFVERRFARPQRFAAGAGALYPTRELDDERRRGRAFRRERELERRKR